MERVVNSDKIANNNINIIDVRNKDGVIFSIKSDGTVVGSKNTQEAALIFAKSVSEHLKHMGWANTSPTGQ